MDCVCSPALALEGDATPIIVGTEGVVGRLQIGTRFVVGGTEGVVGALIVVVVGLGSWLGGPGGSPGSDANEKKIR